MSAGMMRFLSSENSPSMMRAASLTQTHIYHASEGRSHASAKGGNVVKAKSHTLVEPYGSMKQRGRDSKQGSG
jgi:hypothetical protein